MGLRLEGFGVLWVSGVLRVFLFLVLDGAFLCILSMYLGVPYALYKTSPLLIKIKKFVLRTLEHNLWSTTVVTDITSLSKPKNRYHET